MDFTEEVAKDLKTKSRREQARYVLTYLLQRESNPNGKEDTKSLFEFGDIIKLVHDVNKSATITDEEDVPEEEFIEIMLDEIEDRL